MELFATATIVMKKEYTSHETSSTTECVSESGEDPLKSSFQNYRFRNPKSNDAGHLFRAISAVGTLEQNTLYAYGLITTHFYQTSIIAETNPSKDISGFVIGYIPPSQPDQIFVWQIGVLPNHRGKHLGSKLLEKLIELPSCKSVSFITATVASSNQPSDALFRSFSKKKSAPLSIEDFFQTETFLPEHHEEERLYRIGPLSSNRR